MSPCQRKHSKAASEIAYAIKSFTGHLQGTEKSLHTIQNYRSDLETFRDFLEHGLGTKAVVLSQLTQEDLEQYLSYLKARGYKTNTRRRKLLTVRRLVRYLTQRNKITLDSADRLPAPEKVERVPDVVSASQLIAAIRDLPVTDGLSGRDRVLFWTLAESGAQINEVCSLKRSDVEADADGKAWLSVGDKRPRRIEISADLFAAIDRLAEQSAQKRAVSRAQVAGKTAMSPERDSWLFVGHTKHGSLGTRLTPRGAQLLVKAYAGKLGFPQLVPRTFRHSSVLMWHQSGLSRQQILERLGLRTPYALRVYEPLFQIQR